MSPLRAALESALTENPDDLASHMAYADLLVEEGDPRGEFIQVQLALEEVRRGPAERAELKRREEELLERHQAEWIGEAASVFIWPRKWRWEERANWPFGLHHLHEDNDSQPLLWSRGWIEYLDLADFNAAFAEALGRSPTIRLLRHLTIRTSDDDDTGYDRLADWPCLEHVRTFQLGQGSYHSRTRGEDISSCVERMKRIEDLALYAYGVDVTNLFALPMPSLRSLTVHHLRRYPLAILAANRTLGNLVTLECRPHASSPDDAAYITAEGFIALVQSPHLRSLTHLHLHLTDIGDRGIAALVESGMLRRLRVLDLSNGCVSDEGARALASSPNLPRLERLRLAQNQLTRAGIDALRATGVNLEANDQYTAEAIVEGAHLAEGDWE